MTRKAAPAVSTITAELLGRRFVFQAAPGLFSFNVVDDGTRLLLEHLPESTPRSVLDLGCGYGALGLPVAGKYLDARVLLVDRDTLAVDWSRRNAVANGLPNVETKPSLGYRDLGDARFDWVLCNVPARIGEDAIAYLMGEGARRLTSGGELRVVVIRDLGFTVEHLAAQHGWSVRRIVDGPRHSVFALGRLEASATPVDHEAIYARDELEIAGARFLRPHDISEDPAHAGEAVPLLLELLPRAPSGSALVWRGGYGPVAVTLAMRGAKVIAADRDLLATTFTRKNAEAHDQTIETREAFGLAGALRPGERFPWIVGEMHASAGREAIEADLLASVEAAAPSSTVLWLGLTRQAKGWVEGLVKKKKLNATAFATRGPFTVWRVLPPPTRSR